MSKKIIKLAWCILIVVAIALTTEVIWWCTHQTQDLPVDYKIVRSVSTGTDESHGRRYRIDGSDITFYAGAVTGGAILKVSGIWLTTAGYKINMVEVTPGANCNVEQTFSYPQTTLQFNHPIDKPVYINTTVQREDCR